MKGIIIVLALLAPGLSWAQCNALRKKENKATGEIRLTTDKSETASVIREIRLNKTTYYLSLSAPGNTNTNHQGVSLLLDGDTKLDWPNEMVMVAPSSLHGNAHFKAQSYIELTNEQIQALIKKRIVTYKLYVFDGIIKERIGESLRKQIECLVNVNPDEVKVN